MSVVHLGVGIILAVVFCVFGFRSLLSHPALHAHQTKALSKSLLNSRSIDHGDHIMLGEFIHAGQWYIIKNRAEPVAEDEWPFEFKTFKEAQLFFEAAVGNALSRNVMLEIATFFFPFAYRQNNDDSCKIQEKRLRLLVQELLEGNLVLLCKSPQPAARCS